MAVIASRLQSGHRSCCDRLGRKIPMAESTQLRDRARFDALRRRMFAEMGHTAKRWGFFWMALFGVAVLVGLVVRGVSPAQFSIQAVALVLSLPCLVQSIRNPHSADSQHGLLAGMLLYLACVGNTGGIASPFIIVGVPILFGAALVPMRAEMRTILFGSFILGFVAMSL